MKKKDIGTEEVLYRLGLAAAVTAAAVCMFLRLAPPEAVEWLQGYSFCVIYRFTGFVCPGCGGTRALAELLEGFLWEATAGRSFGGGFGRRREVKRG